MPDWENLVRLRLGPLGLEPAREEEIVSELAHHLEDYHEELLRRGLKEGDALEKALASVEDWGTLRKNIRRAELGHPAAPLLVLAGLPILLLVAEYSWRRAAHPLQSSLPAFVSLFGVGILLAAFSKFAGGKPWDRLFAAALPAATIAVAGLVMSLFSRFIYGGAGSYWESVGSLLLRLIAPGLALIVGGLLVVYCGFLRNDSVRDSRISLRPEYGSGSNLLRPSSAVALRPAAMATIRVPWLHLFFALPLFTFSLGALEKWVHGQADYQRLTLGLVEVRLSLPHLAALLLLGILLASATRRLGGNSRAQVLVALVPPAWWLARLVFWGLRPPFQGDATLALAWFAGVAISSVVLPAFAMSLGAVIVVRGRDWLDAMGIQRRASGG
jgi:hypothetical protein